MAIGMGIERQTSYTRKWVRGGLIGIGASATVSLAMNNSNGQLFAVKSMSTDCISSLQSEYNMLKSLDSPYIVKCTGMDFSVENGAEVCNLLMEYMPGGSLGELMNKFGGRLEESVIRAYTSCILRGLEYLHGQGIVHCDVKAKNVLVGTGGVKLADFGSAKRKAEKEVGIEDPWQLRGTPLWMAPEVVKQLEQGPASDIWSLGCTVLEMATGKAPWSNVRDPLVAMYRIGCSDELPEFPPCLSPQGQDFLEKCLRRDPGQRWTAVQLLSHPFLSQNTCSTAKVLNPPLSPRSALDLKNSVWDSCSSSLSVTPTLSLDISRPARKVDPEMEKKSDNLNRPFKSFPKDRVMALAAGCERPAWCSTPSTGEWIVVRSSSTCSPTSNSESMIEEECVSSLESIDEKSQSTVGSLVADDSGEEDLHQLGQLPSWPTTEYLIDRAEETHENSSDNVYSVIQYREVGGNIIQHPVIQRGQNFYLSFDLYSEQICPKLISTGQLYNSCTTHTTHNLTNLIELILSWVHVLAKRMILAVKFTNSNLFQQKNLF